MIRPVLLFVLAAFAAGGLGMYAANLRVSAPERRKRWTKFISYVVIVYSVLLSAAAGPRVFTGTRAAIRGSHLFAISYAMARVLHSFFA